MYFAQAVRVLFLDNYRGQLPRAHLPTSLRAYGAAWARSGPYSLSAAAGHGAAGSSRRPSCAGRFLGPGVRRAAPRGSPTPNRAPCAELARPLLTRQGPGLLHRPAQVAAPHRSLGKGRGKAAAGRAGPPAPACRVPRHGRRPIAPRSGAEAAVSPGSRSEAAARPRLVLQAPPAPTHRP